MKNHPTTSSFLGLFWLEKNSSVMGRNHDEEKGLITAQLSTSQVPRSPLDKTPEWIRPYLELIRFEKVGISFIKPNSNLDTLSFQPTGTILMFWPFGGNYPLSSPLTPDTLSTPSMGPHHGSVSNAFASRQICR